MDTAISRRTKVFLMLEIRFLRDVLARVLGRQPDLEVVGRSGPQETTLEEIVSSGCEVVLVDRVDRDWLGACRARAQCLEHWIKIVAIGMDSDHELFFDAVRLGVMGYLLKDASVPDVVSAVHGAACGWATYPREMCTVLFQAFAGINQDQTKRGVGLTVRQQALMKLVAKGFTNKEIAEELRLSQFTVKNHVSRILKHLDVESRSAAAEVMRAGGYARE